MRSMLTCSNGQRQQAHECPFGGAAHSAPHLGRAAHAFPTWCTRVAVLGLNRHVFGFGRLPLRDGHLQDAVLELGGGVLRLDGRRECDGPRERPSVEFSWW